MVKSVFYILFIFIPFLSIGQENFVPNPSFENYITCPLGFADFSVADWYPPTGGSSDYFNSCNLADVSVPANQAGYQEAHSGNGYSGFASAFEPPNDDAREYIQVQLTSPLEAGKDYLFTGFFSLADSSRYCLGNLGIAFSTTSIGGSFGTPIVFSPLQIFSQNNLLCNVNEWAEVSVNYTALGGEKYLTIGLFFDDNNSITEIVNPSKYDFAYYYVDDVSVIEAPIGEVPNILTPNNDAVNDIWSVRSPNETEFNILNRWGEIVFSGVAAGNSITWNGNTNNNIECSEGVYFYRIQSQTEIKTGFIQLIR